MTRLRRYLADGLKTRAGRWGIGLYLVSCALACANGFLLDSDQKVQQLVLALSAMGCVLWLARKDDHDR